MPINDYPETDATEFFADQANEQYYTSLTNNKFNGQQLINQLIDRDVVFSGDGKEFADAYVDSNGRKNTVLTAAATFDTDSYTVSAIGSDDVFIRFDATSIGNINKFKRNDCNISQVSDGNYICFCTIGNSQEEKRAKLYATLFAGIRKGTSDTSILSYDPAILEATGITSITTNISRDDGGRFWFATHSALCDNNAETHYTFTADATSGNESQSAWLDCALGRYGTNYHKNGTVTILNSDTENGTSPSYTDYAHTIGYDKSDKEQDNPVDAKIAFNNTNDYGSTARMLLLTKVSGSWAYSQASPGSVNSHSESYIDFYTDHNIPLLTYDGSLPDVYIGILEHNIPTDTFTTYSNSYFCSILYKNWEEGVNVEFRLTNDDEDTGYLETHNYVNLKPKLIEQPTKLLLKLTSKGENPTNNYPAIKGFALFQLSSKDW